MKIEPALYRFRNSEQVIKAMLGYTPPSADWGKLYTEAQMRQAMKACAEKGESLEIPKVVHGAHPDYLEGKAMQCVIAASAIRELLKEMLP